MTEMVIALVTGANKGLGFETSRQLAQKGIKVLMGSRNKARGETASKKLISQGLDVEYVELDVVNSEHIEAVKQYIEKKYGRLDILVNNAGMASNEEPLFGNDVETISQKGLREVFDVNFFAAVELTQALLPLIKKSKAGRIVNVSSILGSLTVHSGSDFDQTKPFAYDASKTALNQFTVHLASLLKHTPHKVNSAHPGWVRTDMGGERAPLSAEEGTKTIISLATLGPGGPTGKFIHAGQELPW